MIKAIIGLGNPGHSYYYHRHSIGFRILDVLADTYSTSWRTKENMELAEIVINGYKVFLVKPQTYMNSSGGVIPFLKKQGIEASDIMVVHDELELPFGKIAVKTGGSHKGHNGLKSIIEKIGPDFHRLRFGIGRPSRKEEVPDYVLKNFSEPEEIVGELIQNAIRTLLENFL